ncbi:MAG: hypothetical protein AAF438_23660 [Pseudomonadota bacterium]
MGVRINQVTVNNFLTKTTNEVWASQSYWSPIVTLFVLMLLLIPPHGVLTANEQLYFSLAGSNLTEHPFSSLSPRPYLVAFNLITEKINDIAGANGGQILGRIGVAVLYTFALAALFRRVSLSLVQCTLIVLTFYLMGQEIIGGEWLFGGFEPKTVAYPLCIFGIAASVNRQYVRSVTLFAGATYIHFLVGGIWFGLVVVQWLLQRVSPRLILRNCVQYLVLALPLLWILVSAYAGGLQEPSPDSGESAGKIFKYARNPHHTAPFASIWQFKQWSAGILALPMLAFSSFLIGARTKGPLQDIAYLAGIATVFLMTALPISALDREGVLAPFFLFRPGSLALLLWTMAVITYVSSQFTLEVKKLFVVLTLAVAAITAPSLLERVVFPIVDKAKIASDRSELFDYVKNSGSESVFVIDPEIEEELLDLELETGRPTLVLRKFFGNSKSRIIEWNKRMRFREKLVSTPCDPQSWLDYPASHIVFAKDKQLDPDCGTLVPLGVYSVLSRRNPATNTDTH